MKLFALVLCLVLALVSADPYAASSCTSAECLIENGCKCSSSSSPLPVAETPQLITLAFNDAVTDAIFTQYLEPLLIGRKNPDDVQIGASFYVPHEWTDYARVNQLYNVGMDIGVHSISKSPLSDYWKEASEDTLYNEFYGQRQILNIFANIPIEEVVGGRTPGFEINGDTTFRAYETAGILYDNSWVARSTARSFPFTLHYKSALQCLIGTAPTESFSSTWVMPIVNLVGTTGIECNAIAGCVLEASSSSDVKNWLMTQFQRHYNSNRAPLTLNLNAAWFAYSDYNWPGFVAFLDELRANYSDVFLVDHKQVLEWMKNPLPVGTFVTTTTPKGAGCTATNCELVKGTELRYMKSCSYCPDVFPWVGNPLGIV